MQIKWSPEASQDFKYIKQYIFLDNPIAAKIVISKIFNQAQRLQTFPNIGRAGRKAGTKESVLPDLPYIIIYKPHANHTEIVRIIHTSLNW